MGALLGAESFLGHYVIVTGITFFAAAVMFQVVTPPVEFDASRRAIATLESTGTLDPEQLGGARQVLTAAALTYVAAALVAMLQLLNSLGFLRRH